MSADLLTAARQLAAAGLCVLPAADDGSKRPAIPWQHYQRERPTDTQLHDWFAGGRRHGLGLVCGQVSGGLELTELEARAVAAGALAQLTELATNSGLGDLWQRVTLGGWMVRSPSGGVHLMYRLTDAPVPGNTKLAATADHVTIAETRGEGGWCVTAPSGGPVHPTGQPWQTLAGGPTAMPSVTAEEREALHVLVSTLDERPAPAPASPFAAHSSGQADGGISPGDDYTAKTTWDDVLTPAGWTRVFTRGQVTYWRRPGKSDGISATTGYGDGDWLYVFTSSTELEPERTYTRFGAYTALHHGGDHAAAARALQGKGYGKRPPEPRAPVTGPPLSSGPETGHAPGPAVHGTLATVHHLPLPAIDLDTLERSEDGHAQALIATYGTVIRFCPERGKWLAWDGTVWRWQPEDGGTIREYAKTVARALPETDTGAVAHKRKALSAAGTSGALRQARTDPRVVVPLDQLDARAWELNTPGGIVDLRTGRLQPADPTHLHTEVTTCTPDPDADPSAWTSFLTDTFGDDTQLIAYLQRLVGYSAVGMVGPHILPFCEGSGGNGKGVFLEAVTAVLGDYATTAPAGFLMAGPTAKHEAEIARLAGRRMVVCSEVNETDRFDEAKVKQLTGGDTLTARFMRENHFTFTPTHQLWLMGNHRPEVRSGGRSFWRRLRLVPFKHEVPDERRIDDLQRILATDHGPAVLAWIVAGAAAYHRGGLAEPDTVKVATAEYAHDQDTVARFIEERCHLGGGAHVQLKTTALRGAYETWCAEAGETPVTAKAFGTALYKAGIGSGRTKSHRYYTGVALLDADENASPDPSPAPRSSTFAEVTR